MTGEERLAKARAILADLFQPGVTESDALTVLTLAMAMGLRMTVTSDQAYQMVALKTFELLLRAPSFDPGEKN